MKILVTGATGFIGGAICRELVARGDRVRALHRANSNTVLLDDLPVEHYIGDLNEPPSLISATKGVDAVIHCAAQLGNTKDWQRFYQVTVFGTRAMLNAARQEKVKRFVHTSSVAALGVSETRSTQNISLLSETHTWNFPPQRWQYGYAKYLAELEVQRAVMLGVNAVIVNPTSVFGAGDILRARNSVINLVANRGFRLSAPGGMNVVHIRDVVRGHLAALELGKCGERYILGGENISHERFFRTIQEIAGINSRLINLPLPLIRVMHRLFFITSRILHLQINPGILNLAGYYFYYDLEKALTQLKLPTPLHAHQSLEDASLWFKEYSR